jgi:hypothetical protein
MLPVTGQVTLARAVFMLRRLHARPVFDKCVV